MVSASASTPEVPGFIDHLGDRFIVPQPSGSLLELLYFRPDLAAAPFFEPAVKERLARLANFRHSSYTRARRLQRSDERAGVALVSTHVPGRRLAEILQISARASLRPSAPAALALARQLMTAVALMHDYGPDIFHGAITPERLILPGDGRLVVSEYVLGEVFQQAVSAWGVPAVWRDWGVPMLADTRLGRYGRRVDLLQIGMVVLTFLLGRPLSAADYPEGLRRLLDEACEAAAKAGWPAPEARAWLSSMLSPERPDAFRTLVEAQKGFAAACAAASAAGEVSPAALQAFVDLCESAAWKQPGDLARPSTPTPPTLMSAAAMLEAVSAQAGAPAADDPIASLSGDVPAAAEPLSEEASSPDTDWFTPRVDYHQYEQAESCEVVPAFPLEPEASPVQPQELGSGTSDSEPAEAGDVELPATRLEEEAGGGAPIVASPDPAPGTPASPVGVEEPPALEAPAASPPPRPDTAEPPAAERGGPPRPATPVASASSPRATAPRGTRGLSGRHQSRWRTFAIAASAVLLIGLAAVVAPIAWTRVMGGGLPTGQLAVESVPPGAEVTLDGKAVGRTPVSLEAAAGQHHVEIRLGGSSRSEWVSVPEDGRLVHKVSLPEALEHGSLEIATDPRGGEVWLDGTSRGKSPVRIDGLAPGPHRISASGPFGQVEEQEVVVVGGTVTPVTVPTVGWLRIKSPYSLEVSEKGRVFGETSGEALMVPAGRHHFDLANASLALKVRQFVEVPAGKVVTVPFEAPMGMMNLTSDEPAEVWLDGRLIGQTPLTTLPTTLGRHEVVFRHPRLGDVSYTVNVTLAAPVRLTVTFNKRRFP